MTPVRVGVVGCGEVARRSHLPALTSNPDVRVVGLCDRQPAAIDMVKSRSGLMCPGYSELDRMLEDASPDVVHVCTPGQTHFEVARACLQAGAHVLVEKPPTLNTDDALDLVRVARAHDRKLGAVLNTRVRDTTIALKAALDAGLLGEIRKIHVTHHANLIFSESPSVWDERKSKHLVYEVGVHLLDLLVYLCGPHAEVCYVSPNRQESLDRTTGLDLVIRFGNDVTAVVDITCDSTRHSSYLTQISVYGTAMDGFVRYFPSSFRLAAGFHNPLDLIAAELRATAGLVMRIVAGKYLRHRNQTHRVVIDSFIRWVRGEGRFDTPLEAVIPTMRLLDDVAARIPAYRGAAAASHTPVKVQ